MFNQIRTDNQRISELFKLFSTIMIKVVTIDSDHHYVEN
jgi:hypothetical protein